MKKLVLLLVLLLSSGCTINYNLEIDESNNYQEEFSLNPYETTENTKELLYALYLEEYPIYIDQEFAYYDPFLKLDENDYYEKSATELENGYIFNYKSNYKQSDFSRARSLNTVFKNHNVGYIEETKTYYISASNQLIFANNPLLEQITINIKFDNWIVTNHNADQVNNNTYIWILTPDNNKSININYQDKQEEIETPPIEQASDPSVETIVIEPESNNNLIYIILGSFSLIIIIIVIISIKMKRL